jgi:ADP-ribose pyrophosphatase YjhB (NUDIX family)
MMTDVIWTILRSGDRFLLSQKSTSNNTWTFPGGKVYPDDKTSIGTICDELKKEIGLEGDKFRRLCNLRLGEYHIHVFLCGQWRGELKLLCKNVIGVGWFTLAEMHTLNQSLDAFVSDSLLYLAYLTQHYDSHPDEWREQWRNSDEDG